MQIETLKDQVHLAKEKTDKLISNIHDDKWFETPDLVGTNLNWQIGHIILANYLHGIASISGANERFREKVNVSDYIRFYGPKSDPTSFQTERPSHEELRTVFMLTHSLIIESIDTLTHQDLAKETEVPNPAAKTKYQALLWLSQHHSWHNGQIALLRRVLNTL